MHMFPIKILIFQQLEDRNYAAGAWFVSYCRQKFNRTGSF